MVISVCAVCSKASGAQNGGADRVAVAGNIALEESGAAVVGAGSPGARDQGVDAVPLPLIALPDAKENLDHGFPGGRVGQNDQARAIGKVGNVGSDRRNRGGWRGGGRGGGRFRRDSGDRRCENRRERGGKESGRLFHGLVWRGARAGDAAPPLTVTT